MESTRLYRLGYDDGFGRGRIYLGTVRMDMINED